SGRRAAGSAHLLPGRQLRLGRRPDLRGPDEHARRSPRARPGGPLDRHGPRLLPGLSGTGRARPGLYRGRASGECGRGRGRRARPAAEVDFEVWVLDDRERYASRERFPQAQRLLVGDIGTALKELARETINPSFFCLIVTRGHSHDEEALHHLAPTSAGYVGMI